MQTHAMDKHWRENPSVFMPAIVTCMTVRGNGGPRKILRGEKKRPLRSQNKIAGFKTLSPTPDASRIPHLQR
jgi:hypothetical protein